MPPVGSRTTSGHPDQRGTAIALTGVALAEAALGNGHRARALGQEACRILDRSGDIPGHHGALNNLAIAEILSGHPAQAIDALERALALGIPDTHRSVGWQYMLLAGLRQRSGNQAAASALTAARECFQRSASGVAWTQLSASTGAVPPGAAGLSACKASGRRVRAPGSGVRRCMVMAMAAPQGTHVLGEATLAELRGQMMGSVITPSDPGYDSARPIWNHVIDRHPALILRCSGVADVITGVGFARSKGLPVAIRGGAHSVAGSSTCDGGVVLDLSGMTAVHVDQRSRRALAQGGATCRRFDRETQAHGLATPGGQVSSPRRHGVQPAAAAISHQLHRPHTDGGRLRGQPRVGAQHTRLYGCVRDRPDVCQLHR